MTGVVRCPHCLSVVRAQVKGRCRCPSCGGYFFVPWSAMGQGRPRRSLSSIPRLSRLYWHALPAPRPLAQVVPGRAGKYRGRLERGSPGGQATGAKGLGTIIEPSLYPKDPEWEIIDSSPDYQLIIDFPYHRDQEIAVESEGGILAIRSLKEDAPPRYHIEFALPPEVVEGSLKRVFNNGALTLYFDKKKG